MTNQTKSLVVLFASLWLLAAVDDPLEYQLAVRDAGGTIPRDHVTVARFRSLLKQLAVGYTEKADRIAALTVWTQDKLREEGIQERLLTIMEGMNSILPNTKKQYAQFVAAYVVVRTKGMKHDEAIKGLQGILDILNAR